MNEVIPQDEWQRMPIINRYRHFMRRKFQEMENVYYPHIEELIEKLDDLGEINPEHIPDFSLYIFSFIREWEYGDVSTEYVLKLLRGMNNNNCAEKTVCRRLRNFMAGKENLDSYKYIKAVHDQLQVKCVPLYLKYLEMLTKYYEKMHEIDKKQVPLTWIEQTFKKDGEVLARAREITLNQMFKDIESNILPHNDHRYSVGDNIIVFDEDLAENALACHWIFGPKEYIKLLKTEFKITETMDLASEKEYIKKLIGTFIHDGVN